MCVCVCLRCACTTLLSTLFIPCAGLQYRRRMWNLFYVTPVTRCAIHAQCLQPSVTASDHISPATVQYIDPVGSPDNLRDHLVYASII